MANALQFKANNKWMWNKCMKTLFNKDISMMKFSIRKRTFIEPFWKETPVSVLCNDE